MVRFTVWYDLYNSENVKNTHGGVLLLVTLLHGCFSRFLNCTNGTKPRNASHIMNENAFHFIYLKLPLRLILNLILTQISNSPKNYPFFYYVKKASTIGQGFVFSRQFSIFHFITTNVVLHKNIKIKYQTSLTVFQKDMLVSSKIFLMQFLIWFFSIPNYTRESTNSTN